MKMNDTIQREKSFAKSGVVANIKLIYCFTLLSLVMASCSKIVDNLVNEESTEDILVAESPWVFSGYQNSIIEDDAGSGLSSQEIAEDINQYSAGISFTFYLDGMGFIEIPEQGREDWVWTLSAEQLKTVSDTKTNRYSFFSADQNQMTFEARTTTLHVKDSVQYSVTHVGKYFFK